LISFASAYAQDPDNKPGYKLLTTISNIPGNLADVFDISWVDFGDRQILPHHSRERSGHGVLRKAGLERLEGWCKNIFSYVLITRARDEEAYIGRTLESVVSQTVLPTRWVIVDDGSVDQTAAIVASFAERYLWIQLVQRQRRSKRSFASKVQAFNAGYGCIAGLKYDCSFVVGKTWSSLGGWPVLRCTGSRSISSFCSMKNNLTVTPFIQQLIS
jgi:hypothetical protein